MGSRICTNDSCGATSSHEWKRGWPLRSGGFAHLCYICGTAYEKSVYCERFHLEETGWRDCSSCGKKIHCGCVISKSLYEFLDFGGVGCITCANRSRVCTANELPKGFGGSTDAGGSQSIVVQNRVVGDSVDEGRLMQLCNIMEANEPNLASHYQRPELNESLGQMKQHEIMHKLGEVGLEFSSFTPSSIGSFSKPNNRTTPEANDRLEPFVEPSLNMTLGTPSRTSNFVLPLSSRVVADVREHSKTPSPSFEPQRSRPILPKTLKHGPSLSSESNKGVITPMRIARPPGEGRGKSQLLPRYWPRITDQELEQLSGDLNSTIVPLFEKVLSASDAGRIGRLVLPKACAEAYFPSISQSEGLPLRIQDVKGNEWTFQFRFWPNNNSRMYVLEGVTPCIQAMQLQAGDTVTFSRIDPGGKLIMGFRKSTNNGDLQEAQTSAMSNGILGEPSFSGAAEYPPNGSSFSNLFQTNKGNKDPYMNTLPEHLNLGNGEIVLNKSETNGFRTNGDLHQQPVSTSEKKKTRNIGSKSKRLLMHSEDVLELRLTWEEAQDLLRPPPSANPSIVTIEDHEFEEYDEPPVFGKRTLFVSRPPGTQEQWAQCDDCSKWRRLPVDVLLPSKWSCSDNEWDSRRSSCSAPEEMSLKRLENLLRASKEFKKRRKTESHKAAMEHEPNGLDALASAAVLGDNMGESSIGVTTRHPRHRPGCTCIVCIQPPSGKGKHKPTCTCNVCMTVKRRFKTLMLRKKKRQSEREADDDATPPRKDGPPKPNGVPREEASLPTKPLAEHYEAGPSRVQDDHVAETSSAGQIDLNSHPSREDMQMEPEGPVGPDLTPMNLGNTASSEMGSYTKQNGINGLILYDQQQAGHDPRLLQQANGKDGSDRPDEGLATTLVVWERDNRIDGIFGDQQI